MSLLDCESPGSGAADPWMDVTGEDGQAGGDVRMADKMIERGLDAHWRIAGPNENAISLARVFHIEHVYTRESSILEG